MEHPTIKNILSLLETWAPPATAEDFDNVGLLVGNHNRACTGALITHDTLASVVEEAISKNCNLIISFHPIIFSGLKSLTGKTYVEQAVLKAAENKIAIYALHTALDNHPEGVSHGMSKQLDLINTKILIPKKDGLKKLNFYVPKEASEAVKKTLFAAGAGSLGAYTECSYENSGSGQFRPSTNAQPAQGQKKELNRVEEFQVQLLFESHLQTKILQALQESHPYEEVAFEVLSTDNENPYRGMGMIGELSSPVSEKRFLAQLKKEFNPGGIRHSKLLGRPIQTVAVLGGSGSFGIEMAKQQKADAYVTADLKYHEFYQAEEQLLLVDVGHFESERFTKVLIHDYLSKKMPKFAFILSETNTNPVNYF